MRHIKSAHFLVLILIFSNSYKSYAAVKWFQKIINRNFISDTSSSSSISGYSQRLPTDHEDPKIAATPDNKNISRDFENRHYSSRSQTSEEEDESSLSKSSSCTKHHSNHRHRVAAIVPFLRKIITPDLIATTLKYSCILAMISVLMAGLEDFLVELNNQSDDDLYPFKECDLDFTSNIKNNKREKLLDSKTRMFAFLSIKLQASSQMSHRKVETILRSLNQVEVQILQNCLLCCQHSSSSAMLAYDRKNEGGSCDTDIEYLKRSNSRGEVEKNYKMSPLLHSTDEEQHIYDHYRSDTRFEDIGGLDNVKLELMEIIFTLMNPNFYSGYGALLSSPKGILFYGPPGCGKTMLARALATESKVPFLIVQPSHLLSKFVGDTNRNVQALFSLARKLQPCVIFLDEIDGLFRERNADEHDVTRELKVEFMQLWDGIATASPSLSMDNEKSSVVEQIIVIGATNRPIDIDSAFRRRMPKSYFIGLPSFHGRQTILRTFCKNIPTSDSFDFEELARATEGYSPADLKELLRTAAHFPLREARMKHFEMMRTNNINNNSNNMNKKNHQHLRPLTTDDVLLAQQNSKPTQFSANYLQSLNEYMKQDNINYYSGGNLQNSMPSLWNEEVANTSSTLSTTEPTVFDPYLNYNENSDGVEEESEFSSDDFGTSDF